MPTVQSAQTPLVENAAHPGATTVPTGPSRRRARTWVAGAALWLWVLASLLPMLELGVGGLFRGSLALAFPAMVLLGLVLDELAHRRHGHGRRISEAVLFGLAPLAVVASLAGRPELTSREVLGPSHVAFVVLAAATYLGTNAMLAASHLPRRRARAHPLPTSARIVERRWPRVLRWALIASVAFAGVAFVALAPLVTGQAGRAARYGVDGAETAALLASTVGTALGVVTLGWIVAPSMRARGAVDTVPSRWRGLAPLGIAALAFAAWAWLEAAR